MIRWVLALLLLPASAWAADLTVLSAGAFKPVAAALMPSFEAQTGNHLTLRDATVGALLRRIGAGEQFDVVLLSDFGLEALANSGKVVPGSATNLARVGIGVAVKVGAPAPAIRTVAAFRATMLNVRSVAYIDPEFGGSSGIYVAGLFQKLGIAAAMAPKSIQVKGGLAAEAVANNQAEMVIHQISEIIAVPGVTMVGPLPPEIQSETIYAGAVSSASSAPDAARAFLAHLSSRAAQTVLTERGMLPP